MIDGLTIDHFGQIQFLNFVKILVWAKISVSVKISVLSNFWFGTQTLGLRPVFKMM